MNTTTSTRSYYPALDGLRGIAILLVICCHNFDFLPFLKLGWIGVDLFFVLSGFLITDILLKTKETKHFLRNFYIRRILKIFPLYYGVLLLFFAIAPALLSIHIQYNYYQTNQPMLWLHLQNWLCIIHIRPVDSMLLNHFWSLSIEEQFYLIWPILVLSIKSTRILGQVAILILVTCILTRFSSWLYFGDGYSNFTFQYMTRMDGLCVGSLIAIWRFSSHEQAKKKVMRLGIVVLSLQLILFFLSKTILLNFPEFTFFGYTSIAVIFGIIVFLAIEKRNFISRLLLENAGIKFVGKISYGLYVYHWPILALFKIYLLNTLVNKGFTPYSGYVTVSLMAVAVAVVVSILSYYFFEKKILALKDIITADGFFARAWKKLILFFTPPSTR